LTKSLRGKYWDQALLGDLPNLQSNYKYCKIFELEMNYFAAVRDAVFESLIPSTDIAPSSDPSDSAVRNKIKEFLDGTTSVKVNYDMNVMTKLDVALHKMLYSYGLLSDIQGIEFPVNIRVAHGEAPNNYLENSYATDFLHCDPWAGSPADNINCLIYIDVDELSSFCEIYDMPDELLNEVIPFKGPYEEGNKLLKGITEIEYQPKPGVMLLFDGFTPHGTARKGTSPRISIDFRLRRRDPYEILDDRWLERNIGWAKYWYLNTELTPDWKKRKENEMSLLRNNKKGIEFRKRAFAQV
jgi:hypothetical protein